MGYVVLSLMGFKRIILRNLSPRVLGPSYIIWSRLIFRAGFMRLPNTRTPRTLSCSTHPPSLGSRVLVHSEKWPHFSTRGPPTQGHQPMCANARAFLTNLMRIFGSVVASVLWSLKHPKPCDPVSLNPLALRPDKTLTLYK